MGVFAIAWGVVVYGTGGALILRIPLGVAISALCALLALMGVVGAVQAWRGASPLLRLPAKFTVGLFAIAIINLLVQGRISWSPSQTVPLAVGVVAALALLLSYRPAAAAWLTRAGAGTPRAASVGRRPYPRGGVG